MQKLKTLTIKKEKYSYWNKGDRQTKQSLKFIRIHSKIPKLNQPFEKQRQSPGGKG